MRCEVCGNAIVANISIEHSVLLCVSPSPHPSRSSTGYVAQKARTSTARGSAGAMDGTLAVANGGFAARLVELWERPETKKARRVGYHVVRATKKFVFGTGNAAWVVGTTVLVMVMPLVFEIDREQQSLEQMGVAQLPP